MVKIMLIRVSIVNNISLQYTLHYLYPPQKQAAFKTGRETLHAWFI